MAARIAHLRNAANITVRISTNVLLLSSTPKTSRELLEAALRVLLACNDGRAPASLDRGILKDAFPSSAYLPDDELACQVIHDLSGRLIQESTQKDSGVYRAVEVASDNSL